MAPVIWQPKRDEKPVGWPVPKLATALKRGLLGRCPACGQRNLFKGYLRVVGECAGCSAPLGSARADDAPPYFTIVIVGHIVVPLILLVEKTSQPSVLAMSAIFLPLTLVLSLGLLRPVKGATVGAMVTLGMISRENDDTVGR